MCGFYRGIGHYFGAACLILSIYNSVGDYRLEEIQTSFYYLMCSPGNWGKTFVLQNVDEHFFPHRILSHFMWRHPNVPTLFPWASRRSLKHDEWIHQPDLVHPCLTASPPGLCLQSGPLLRSPGTVWKNTGSKFKKCGMFARKVLLVGSNAKRFWFVIYQWGCWSI